MNILLAFKAEPDAGMLAEKEWQAAAQGKSMPQTANYMKLADSVAAAIQEIVLIKGDAKEILTRYQDEYNARYAGE